MSLSIYKIPVALYKDDACWRHYWTNTEEKHLLQGAAQQLASGICPTSVLKRENQNSECSRNTGRAYGSVISLVIVDKSSTPQSQRQKIYVSFRQIPVYLGVWSNTECFFPTYITLLLHQPSCCWICWWQSSRLNTLEISALLPEISVGRDTLFYGVSRSQDPNPDWKVCTQCQIFSQTWADYQDLSSVLNTTSFHSSQMAKLSLNSICKCRCSTNDTSWIRMTY